MKLSDLISELQAVQRTVGPNAPVLEHARLRVTNMRDSVQVFDPGIIKEERKVYEAEIENLETRLGNKEEEVEELRAELAKV